MPLTTLHLTNAWHSTSGGIRTFYLALLEAANRDHRRVVVVAPAARAHVERVGRFGTIHFIAATPAIAFDRRYRTIYPHQYLPWLSNRFADIFAQERPDIVEISDKYSLPYVAGLLRRGWFKHVQRPALVGLSCERFDDNMAAYLSRGAWARRFVRWYLRNIYGPPFDVHVANSNYTADELRAAMPERAESFVRVCPMGVDSAGFSPAHRSWATRDHLLRQLRGSTATTLLFYAGRLSPEKNLSLLIDALRHQVSTAPHADYRLVIAGDGPLAPWIRAQAAGVLSDRILLLGNLNRQALAACLASCDVFVHPNPREPFGIGPLEAMASGCPVVVPNSGGVLTYANRSNAWVAESTTDGFGEAIAAAATGDPARIVAARATAEAFRWEDATRRYFALYDEIHNSVIGQGRSRHTPNRAPSRALVPASN